MSTPQPTQARAARIQAAKVIPARLTASFISFPSSRLWPSSSSGLTRPFLFPIESSLHFTHERPNDLGPDSRYKRNEHEKKPDRASERIYLGPLEQSRHEYPKHTNVGATHNRVPITQPAAIPSRESLLWSALYQSLIRPLAAFVVFHDNSVDSRTARFR